MKNSLYSLFLILAMTSCITRVDKYGYMFDLSEYQDLREGVSGQTTVLKSMGSPTIISDLGEDESWIYYQEEVRSLLFFMPDIISRTVITINFDNNGTIKNLEEFDLNKETKLQFSSNYTKVNSQKIGFFKSIFSNVGKVKPQ